MTHLPSACTPAGPSLRPPTSPSGATPLYKSDNGGASAASEARDRGARGARVMLGAHAAETQPRPASLQQPLPKKQAGVEVKRHISDPKTALDSRDALTRDLEDQETKIVDQAKTIAHQAARIAEQDDEIKSLNLQLHKVIYFSSSSILVHVSRASMQTCKHARKHKCTPPHMPIILAHCVHTVCCTNTASNTQCAHMGMAGTGRARAEPTARDCGADEGE